MHEGVPPGGALVPELLARANSAVGNALDALGVEIVGSLTLRAVAPSLVAGDDGRTVELPPGTPWTVTSGRARVAYAAARGGFDAPFVLGGRGTLLAAALGGHEGRGLRKGDRLVCLATATPRPAPSSLPALPELEAPVRVVPGPDLERFAAGALDLLFTQEFRVSPRSDRVGVRLVGPALRRPGDDLGVSAPMVRGAIQVPVSGEPIVLGPDHPTTGGYPVIATVFRAELGGLLARPVGASVRFVHG
jgi:allophanate hydrolase subunit 2